MTGDKNSDQLGKSKNYVLAPGTLSNSWSEADTRSFLLGLFIFGKNFIKIKRLLENKGMGEMLSFYYGKFYKSDEYRRWSDCRKTKGRKCIMGQKLFSGLRQQELLSRLIPHVSKESQDSLLQVSTISSQYFVVNELQEVYFKCLMVVLPCISAFSDFRVSLFS